MFTHTRVAYFLRDGTASRNFSGRSSNDFCGKILQNGVSQTWGNVLSFCNTALQRKFIYWLWRFKGHSAIPPPPFDFPESPRVEQHQSLAWINSLRGFPLITAPHCSSASSGVLTLLMHTHWKYSPTHSHILYDPFKLANLSETCPLKMLFNRRCDLLSTCCTSVLHLLSPHVWIYKTCRYVNVVICIVSSTRETFAKQSVPFEMLLRA